MPKLNVVVDRVTRIDPSNRSLLKEGVHNQENIVVHFGGASALLDINDNRSAFWEKSLDELRQSNDPVYIETDPYTNIIQRVLFPRSVVVTSVASEPSGSFHEIELHISHGRHFLNIENPDYQQLLNTLTVAYQYRLPVLVTEELLGHEIIDVRIDSVPFTKGLVQEVKPPLGSSIDMPFSEAAVTLERAKELFTMVARQPYIPFNYPDDGCWARAHEMCRLIIASNILAQPRKIWIYGNLKVSTRNHPNCSVEWGWHVAPTLLVETGTTSEIYVIDPSLFTEPVTKVKWVNVQNDPNRALQDTDANVFYRNYNGDKVEYDSDYSQTQQILKYYKRELDNRVSIYGPPPYSNCP